MMRVCERSDPNVGVGEQRCGRVFDDAKFSTLCPHEPLPTRVRIRSNGASFDTYVEVNGEALDNVRRVTWTVGIDEFAVATIELNGVEIDAEGTTGDDPLPPDETVPVEEGDQDGGTPRPVRPSPMSHETKGGGDERHG